MDWLIQDVRYAVRTMIHAPTFTAVAVLTLALGIGANTVVFGIVNAVLLRPLPFDRPEQLVKIWGQIPTQRIPQNWISEPELWDLRDNTHGFAAIAAYNTGTGANLTRNGGDPVRVTISQASADLLPMLGVKPARGRLFNAEEDQPGRGHVAVLDYAFWNAQLAGDAAVVGREIELNGDAFTVVGVLPEGFSFGGETNIWTPIALDRARPNNRGNHYLDVLARLNGDVSMAQGSADVDAAARRMVADYPLIYPKDSGFSLYLRPLQTDLVGPARLSLVVVFAAVGFVLLIACINFANLLLARGLSRSRELAVRAALGAGRLRIARQLVTESVLIAAVGGGCGVLLARWTIDALRNTAAVALPQTRPVTLDASVLLFAAGASLVTGIVFGLVPALRTSKAHGSEALKDAARGTSSGSGQRLRSALVVSEIALAVVLLTAAGLTLRSLRQLLEVNPGFHADRLLTARLSLPPAHYTDTRAANAFFAAVEDGLRTLPGVTAVGMTTLLPMTGRNSSGSTFIDDTATEGLTAGPPFQKPYIEADLRTVTPSFFPSMQIPLLRGRTFTAADAPDTAPVIVVDEEFAQRIWPDRDPIGQRLAVNAIRNSNPPVLQWRSVVGIVGHVKNNALDQLGREQTYVPLSQTPFTIRSVYLTVRTAADPGAIASAVQRVVRGLDQSLPVYQTRPMLDWLDSTVSPRRFTVMLLVSFGALALTLAAIGTYGVVAYSVSQRTQEIGVRMALGATSRDVQWMVVGGGLRLATAGVLLGLVLSVGAARFMATLLFGVGVTDPMTFAAVAGVLLATAVFAAWVPARRATQVDPMAALRAD
ncbi:MAG TPA: ABC transporter permease [Vicinamibacterales bacterium]|nr:ABC transporter permease [Vicinamibacterales bacterium]